MSKAKVEHSSKRSVIKDSSTIRESLIQRMQELNMKPSDLVKDAETLGRKIDNGALSKYVNHGNVKGALSEEDVVWIATRWGIDIQLVVGKIKIVQGKLNIVLAPYKEEEAINKLKLIFG